MQKNKKQEIDKQTKTRKFHCKYIQLPQQDKSDLRDYDILSLMGQKRGTNRFAMGPQMELYKERNYQGQILNHLMNVIYHAQNVLKNSNQFPEQVHGVISKETIKNIQDQLLFLITNFQLIQTDQVKKQQKIIQKQLDEIQKNPKLTQFDKKNRSFQIRNENRKYYKEKINIDNFYELCELLNVYLKKQRLKLEKEQTYGFSEQSIFAHMCRSCDYFTTFNDLQCNYDTVYQIPIDIPYLKAFNHNELLTQKHIDLLLCYFQKVEGLNNQVINNKCILNVSKTDDFLKGFQPNIKITKYKQAGLLFSYDKTQWFMIGVFNQEKKIVVYDTKFSHDRNYRQYIESIDKIIFNQTKGTLKYQSIYEKQNITQESNQYQNGYYILYAMIHLIDDVFHDGFNNKIIRVLNRKRVVERLRNRLRTFTSYLIWCQTNNQPVRADIFSFLIREALYKQITYHRD